MCGIFGIFNHSEASNIAYLGLHSLQHRGQESAGMVSTDGYSVYSHREMGLVSDIFDEPTLEKLSGKCGYRPRQVLHRGFERPQERAALCRRVRKGSARRRPQRQPHERENHPG